MKHFGEEIKGAEQLLTGQLENKLAHLRKKGTLRAPGTESGRFKCVSMVQQLSANLHRLPT